MIGARDVAFPRLNALSYWLYLLGGVVLMLSFFANGGAAQAGWTSYVPLAAQTPGNGQDLWILSLHILTASSLAGAINFIVTIHNMRTPGMTWTRMPLFVWSIIVFAWMLVAVLPTLSAGLTLLLLDRGISIGGWDVQTHFFDATDGGAPLLWQHAFWFFGHPEVYIIVLPAFGIISEVLPVFARKPIFGYKAVAFSSVGIGFFSMLVWAHHMFTVGLPNSLNAFFMITSMTVAVPTGVKIFNWIATLWRGSLEFKTPLYFGVGFLAFFTLGGVSGVMLAIFPLDWQLTDTYFVVAHFHYVLVAGAVNAILAGLYYWFPKMTGRMLSEGLGKLSFWLTFVGFNVTFLVQHSIGMEGMPRRVYEYADTGNLHVLNLISTIGAFILATGVLVTVVNVLRSLKRGAVAGPDPWKANTLEWFVTSPPPPNNFDVIPRVRSVEPMKDIRRAVRRSTEERAGREREPVKA
jgi:cytochrome c oxidase subunit 1